MTDLTWFGWLVVALWVMSTLLTVYLIGKPRPTTTPGSAVFVVAFNAALIVGLLTVGANR